MRKGDLVEITVQQINWHPGCGWRPVGKYEAVVLSGWQRVSNGGKSTDRHSDAPFVEITVRPTDWDHVCDLLQREGSMSWTEINQLRQSDRLENVQVDEQVRLIGPSEVTVLAHVHVKMPHYWTEDQLREFMEDRDLELIMAEEL